MLVSPKVPGISSLKQALADGPTCASGFFYVPAGPKPSKHQALQQLPILNPVSRLASDLCLPH